MKYVRWILSCVIVYFVYTETGIVTSLTIAGLIIATELQDYINRQIAQNFKNIKEWSIL